MADDDSKRVKASSVAAFLFMPQFRLSFQHLSFIVPVFIRIVAVMFEQSGLLPPNHPATRYGIEGVKKYSFRELIGEAWYTLRSTSATPYQWGLFAGIVMMIVFTILSAITAVINVSTLFASEASAQIFDHPTGLDTSISTTPGGVGGIFDSTVPASGGHADYGIMILDKMLRQGAAQKGGALQNAVSDMMGVYNTGVLVIAAVMLFWIIVSVVTDTAKTGQIGGGRHNMVWAPIRIVFALGLLVPLGATGSHGQGQFSAGQYGVMKLAEWGSNFGSRAWVAYVNSVARDQSLLPKVSMNNISGIVNQYTKMWVCRAAYNAFSYQSMGMDAGDVDADQLIVPVYSARTDKGMKSFSFTNATGDNLCGTLTYPTDNDDMIRIAEGADTADTVGRTPLTAALAEYKKTVRKAYRDLFITGADGVTSNSAPGDAEGGKLASTARDLACDFVHQFVYAPTGKPSPLEHACKEMATGGYSGSSGCTPAGGGGGSGIFPGMDCLNQMSVESFDEVEKATGKAYDKLTLFIKSKSFIQDVETRGWAGMGMWYHRISQLGATTSSMAIAPITIADGTVMNTPDPSWSDEMISSVFGESDENKQIAKVREIALKYQVWWQTVPAAAVDMSTFGVEDKNLKPSDAAKKDAGLKSAIVAGDSKAITGAVAKKMTPDVNPFWVLLHSGPNDTLYPLAKISSIGDNILLFSVTVNALISALSLFAMTPFVGQGFAAFMESPIVDMFASAANATFLAGALLSYYLPILPFIRVAHAVLTWMISVFEAVVMVPIAALAHLTTEGEGLAGGAKSIWVIWLNVLMRPVLTVIGFVGALVIFNTFVVFFHSAFATTLVSGLTDDGTSVGFFAKIAYTIMYVMIIYAAANSTFKLLDIIPSALMKYMGGQPDQSFDNDGAQAAGAIAQAGGGAAGAAARGARGGAKAAADKRAKKADTPESRAQTKLADQDAIKKLSDSRRPGAKKGK